MTRHTMLALPFPSTDQSKLADWLELLALVAPDATMSQGDLERALRVAAVVDPDDGSRIEENCLQVFHELEARLGDSLDGYPFWLDGRCLRRKLNWVEYPAYVFCLCLSYFRWKPKQGSPIDPWRLFEELSCIAAQQYVQGDGFRFGSRGRTEIAGFRRAVERLCERMGEGEGCRKREALRPQDDKVDLVVWRDFADRRRSKLIMFGQCAAGGNWRNKASEMDTQAFWDQWMIEPKVSPLIRSFYVPHIIPKNELDYFARRGGVLFDRCRIAYWASRSNSQILGDSRYITWCKTVFPDLRKKHA